MCNFFNGGVILMLNIKLYIMLRDQAWVSLKKFQDKNFLKSFVLPQSFSFKWSDWLKFKLRMDLRKISIWDVLWNWTLITDPYAKNKSAFLPHHPQTLYLICFTGTALMKYETILCYKFIFAKKSCLQVVFHGLYSNFYHKPCFWYLDNIFQYVHAGVHLIF